MNSKLCTKIYSLLSMLYYLKNYALCPKIYSLLSVLYYLKNSELCTKIYSLLSVLYYLKTSALKNYRTFGNALNLFVLGQSLPTGISMTVGKSLPLAARISFRNSSILLAWTPWAPNDCAILTKSGL